jgi:flagellar hook-associated protein 3 FlgL
MRVADKMAYEQVNANIGKNRTNMAELQNQAATQKRVNKPSDDPLAAARVLANRVDLQGNKQYTKSLGYAHSFLAYTDTSLGDLTETLVRAKELAINQSNDASAGPDTRRVVATEVNQLLNSMVQIGNRKLGDRFIFGGYKTQSNPFDKNGDYKGDKGEMMIHVDKDAFVPMNVPGDRIFHGDGFTSEGFHGVSQEQARNVQELTQQMTPKEGEEPSPEMRGPASIGSVGANGSNAEPNSVLLQSGHRVDGGVNLFRVLQDFETSLRTNDKKGIQSSLDLIDQAISQVVLTRAQIGARSTTIENLVQTMDKEKGENLVSISNLEDADIYSTVSDINKTESTLQATLQTSGKILQKSLMDFLR